MGPMGDSWPTAELYPHLSQHSLDTESIRERQQGTPESPLPVQPWRWADFHSPTPDPTEPARLESKAGGQTLWSEQTRWEFQWAVSISSLLIYMQRRRTHTHANQARLIDRSAQKSLAMTKQHQSQDYRLKGNLCFPSPV